MPRYRSSLPQLAERIFITDAGLETELVFHDGRELPCFAAYDLLKDDAGRARLGRYYGQFAATARARGVGLVLESPTWRASADWGAKLGHDAAALYAFNRAGISLMTAVRDAYESEASPMVVSGQVGPRGDGYDPGRVMTADEAEDYHAVQIATFAGTEADLVTAVTMTNVPEATGIVRAAVRTRMPVVVSFTLETDGRLPTGDGLGEAIDAVDTATGGAPEYYMINCAHPVHFDGALDAGEPWTERLRGLRANASMRSHAELDAATDLDDGDPADLGRRYAALRRRMPQITVLGGCCGTDHRHVEAICLACLQA
jgi:S-methylmethionine-dependent homocysteine/selenocysteine methylase